MNRQIGVGDSKYAVIYDPLQTDHVVRRMHSVLYMAVYTGICMIGSILDMYTKIIISVTITDGKKVSTDHL